MTVRLSRILFFTIAFAALSITGYSQEKCCYALKGQLVYKNGEISPSTIISLYKSNDSSRLLSTITDSAGLFRFASIPEGEYFIGIQLAKNKTRLLPSLYKVNRSIDSVTIEVDPAKTLQEVVVVSKKPFLQKESDRLVINLDNSSLTKGNSLLEAFRKLPGLDVVGGNSVTVNGNPDVLLIIDGKSYRSSTAQAVQLLNSIRSENVEKIEIYTTPPARYEAEGTSIINVVLKKDKILSGVYATYGQRIYPEHREFGGGLNQFSGGGNFFYSIGKFRFNTRIGWSDNSTSYTRSSYDMQFADGLRRNNALLTSDAGNLFANMNANYVSGNHTFSLGVSYNKNYNVRIRSLNEDIFFNKSGQRDSLFQSTINTTTSYTNPVVVLSYDYLIDKKKAQSVSFSGIVGDYRNDYDVAQNIVAFMPSAAAFLGQNQDYSVKSYAFKADYTQTSKVLGKIDAGLKRTQLRNKDLYSYTDKSFNTFVFDESINALYLSVSRTLKNKISYTAGMRVEQTRNEGTSSLLPGKSIERDYINLFPSFSLQYPTSKKSKLGLSYSRRISRPSYTNFNPANYALFNDAFSSQEGNINLKPQYISKYELSLQQGTFYSALTYTRKANVRTVLAEVNANRFVNYRTINITGHDMNLLSFYSRKLAKWTEANISASGQYYFFRLADNSATRSFAWRLSGTQSFTITPTFSCDISVRYYSPYRMEYWKVGGYYTIDAGARKSLLNNTFTLALTLNDLTGSNKMRWEYFYPDFTKTVNPLTNERLFSISIAYRFKTGNRFQLKRTTSDEFGEMRFYK